MSAFRALVVVLALAGLARAESDSATAEEPRWREGSFLKDEKGRQHQVYEPAEGDIVIFEWQWHLVPRPKRTTVKLMTMSRFVHAAVIVRDGQGAVQLLEADKGTGVRLHEPLEYLRQMDEGGWRVYIRRLQESPGEEASQAMTEFAESVEGQPYAALRELISYMFSAPGVDELPNPAGAIPETGERWFCTELVVRLLQEGQLFSPHIVAGGTAPKHFFGERFLLYPKWDYPFEWSSWVYCRGRCLDKEVAPAQD